MQRAWIGGVLLVLGSAGSLWGQTNRVEDLRCEYLKDPLGIDTTEPRLSWTVQSQQRAQRQTAYEVLVASSPERLKQDQGDLWQSGKVASDETAQVVYAGKPLGSRQACFWKVRAWDRDGKPGDWSQPALWEMGLLKAGDWKARWIQADLEPESAADHDSLAGAKWIWFPEPGVDLAKSAPPGDRFFRLRLSVPAGVKPEKARLTLTVDDQFTLFVNGKQVERFAEKDGWKRPRHYDLLPLLTPGDPYSMNWRIATWALLPQLEHGECP